MERIEKYRQLIHQLLSARATPKSTGADIECQLVFDTEHDPYQLLDMGWDELKRVYSCYIHIDIKKSQIWIQRNMTEIDIAEELVIRGVPKEDIILGLHPPYKHPYIDYGIA